MSLKVHTSKSGSVLDNPDKVVEFIRGSGFEALFFEVSHDRKEMACIKSFRLAQQQPNPSAYAEHFERSDREAPDSTCVAFRNLSGTSWLISPKPLQGIDPSVYGHVAAFVRGAPDFQVREFFKLVQEYAQQNPDHFVSTHGLGIPWLHSRIEPTSKLYTYQPFTVKKE